jgi:transmembrane sensor
MSPGKAVLSRADEEALGWASRIDAGLGPKEQAELERWLARDPAHEWRLAHFRQFYARLHGTVPVLLAEGRVNLPVAAAPRRFRPGLWAAGLAASAVLVVGTLLFLRRPQEVSTTTGQRQGLTLADGSRADVNSRTLLSIQLRGAERRVHLEQGEAYFEVAKDPARPFLVETAAGTVRVTGTRFNVRIAPSGSLEVTVLEGSVAVSTATAGRGAREYRLQPHDQLLVAGGLVTAQQLGATVAANVIAWREGKVVFDDTPLAVALEHFAAYHGRQLSVAPEVAGLLIGGRFTLEDCDAFLTTVEKMLPVRSLRGENRAVRFVPAEAPAVRR